MSEQSIHSYQDTNTTGKTPLIDFLPALFLLVAIFLLPVGLESDSINSFAIFFVSIALEAIPFMLIGALVSGFIEVFVSRERLAAVLPNTGWLTVCLAAAAGIFFPICECAVVPIVRRLINKGLSFSAAIAYLLGGPIVNPIVAASTALAYAFDWQIVLLRLGLGYVLAVVIGMIMGKLFDSSTAIVSINNPHEDSAPAHTCHHHLPGNDYRKQSLDPAGASKVISNEDCNTNTCECSCDHSTLDSWIDKTGAAIVHAKDDFLTVGHYLVIGAFVAALAQTYINRESFLDMTTLPVLSIVLMMGLAIMLNLCSEADAFIAASFRGLMPMPAQLAFLLTGPMFDLKLLLMYQTVFKRRVIITLATLILVGVLMMTTGIEIFNGAFQ